MKLKLQRVLAKTNSRLLTVIVLGLAGMAFSGLGLAPAEAAPHDKPSSSSSDPALRYDVSPPLTDLAPAPPPPDTHKKEKEPKKGLPVPAASSTGDPVVQSSPGTASAPSLGLNFEGIGQGLPGPSTGWYAPPDPNGAVGPSHYVEVVNTDFAIFDKSGALVYGPAATNTLWSGFGGGCEANNDGDATVDYDKLAGRWIFQQFSVSSPYPYSECIAVSTTSDPTGSYNRYEFGGFGSNFPDYPKLSVWPNAYYVTYNLFRGGSTFVGPEVCAYDRAHMLLGQPASGQCRTLSSSYGSLLPADVDGSTAPPSGSPNYVLSFGTNSLRLWKFHVDWGVPTSSTLTGPTTIPVAAFSPACSGGGSCIPQQGTTQKLDSLADRLMYRLAYRNFGDHQSLTVDHSVVAGSSVGVRWYELRLPGGVPTVYQQGTYAPDSSYRWMGSIAMDGSGDIGLGYSISSSSVFPGIAYTGRLAGDPLNQMTQGEGTLIIGAGSQTGGLGRWGDYTSMSVDPTDDCTFWYTNQYLASTGSFNWSTHIGTFRLPGCGQPDFSLSSTPSSQTVTQGQPTSYDVTVSPSNGFSDSVNLGVSGLPSGASGSFTQNPTTGTSTLSVTTSTSTPAGSYPLTITGTSGTLTHTTTPTLVVQGPAPDFSLSASPSDRTVNRGGSTSYTVTITQINGFNGSVSLSVSGLPSRTSASFSPNPATTSATLSIGTKSKGPAGAGTYTLTIRGTSGSLAHSTTVTLTLQ